MKNQTPQFSKIFAHRLIQLRWQLLVIAMVLACISYLISQRIRFENSIEGMFAAENRQLVDYQQLKNIFGGTEIVLAVYHDSELFSQRGEGFERLENYSQEISQVRGVMGVLSLAEINGALKKVYALVRSGEAPPPILDPDDRLAREFLKIFEGYTHGSDHQTAAIVCLLEPSESSTISRASIIRDLRRIVSGWPDGQITGEPVLVADGFRFIRRDGQRLNRMSLLLMSFVIIACFRSIRWVLIPVCVMQLAVWITMAILVLLDWQLTMVSSMLSAIVAVVSVATVIHITIRFRESRLKHGRTRIKSVENAFETLMVPITWTCITTAAGFLALTLADVEPVSDFGWMMAIGSLVVLLSIMLLVPGLALLGKFDSDPQKTWGDWQLTHILTLSTTFLSRHPRKIGLAIFAVFAVVAWGLNFLEVQTDFIKNFRPNTPIVRAYRFVETKLGGAGILDVVIPAPATIRLDFLEQVDGLQDELRDLRLSGSDQPALTHVVSFADADRAIRSNRLLTIVPPEMRFKAMAGVMPGFAAQMKTTQPAEDGRHYFRIMLRTSQQKSADQQTELIAKVRETVAQHFPDQVQRGETLTTGFFVLLANLINSVLEDQTRTFVAATIFIAISIFLAFGSLKLVFIGLIPNILPIIGLMGMLGWLGININIGAAMIAAVSIGLSIDGTIHYLHSYRYSRRAGHHTSAAIKNVQQRIGRAVTYATLALVVGFGSLCISEFIPTVFFGALVGLSMLGGMFGNLVLLPILLTVFDQDAGRPAEMASAGELTREGSSLDQTQSVLNGPHVATSAYKPTELQG